jgi:hypothetical protein
LPRPFELDPQSLKNQLEAMVSVTFSDLQSQFLVLPKGPNFVEYAEFQNAYEVLKRETNAFETVTDETIWAAMCSSALSFMVLRTILGVSPPEWADLARTEIKVDVPQNVARDLDTRCRKEPDYFQKLAKTQSTATKRVAALVSVAVFYLTHAGEKVAKDTVHRLAKIDTTEGLSSLRHAASHHVPYAVLLYERYLGRPFASHRDSVSEFIGDVMESAIEERLTRSRISFRKTKRAERIPGFDQAPDFIVPDEINPAVIIEAKITGDDGTARDKVTRIERLAAMRDERIRRGEAGFEVVACIDGRGFGVRREDMRKMLLRTYGKVFTLSTLDQLVEHTRLRDFLPRTK